MTAVRPLLVELLVEELPPKALKTLSAAFADALVGRLEREGLVAAAAKRSEYATPRRLAVVVDGVSERAAYIGRIRNLARSVAQSYLASRERLGFPLAPRAWADETIAQLVQKRAA